MPSLPLLRKSAIPATKGKWSKFLHVPTDRLTAVWFDPTEKTIVVHALISDAHWFTDHELYMRTDEDLLDTQRAYYILDGSPCLT